METQEDLVKEIKELKESRDASILAHFYETGDIQDIADGIGDSLYLASQGQKLSNKVIVMAGVVFMGETVKILSPEKTVLVPDINAGCSLVDSSPFDKYKAWKDSFPNSVLVSYVNSSAKAKTITDVVCTSTNAQKIIEAIPLDKKVLFGPDKNLGAWLNSKTKRDMELWPGACEVHVLFSAKKLFQLRKAHPNALVLAHPECNQAILDQSDLVGSTSRLLNEVKTNKNRQFIIATESGILHQMQKHRPDAELIQAPAEGSCACNDCPYMKLNTLQKVRDCLRDLNPEITLSDDIIETARIPLQRMMNITEGNPVSWPGH